MSTAENILAFRVSSWAASFLLGCFVYARLSTMPGRFNRQLILASGAALLAMFFYTINPVRFWWIRPRGPSTDWTDLVALGICFWATWTWIRATDAVKKSRRKQLGMSGNSGLGGDQVGFDSMEARLPPDVQEELSRLVNRR